MSTRALASPLEFTARLRPAVFVSGAFVVALGLWYAAQVIVLDGTASAAIGTSVAGATAPLRPDDPIRVTVNGAGVQLAHVQLVRTDLANTAEQPVPVLLQPTAEANTWQVVSLDGTAPVLRPDGAYRLGVRIAAPRPSLPMPRTDFVERQYRFTTVPSPHAMLPSSELHPRWSEPVSVAWSAPMLDVSATVQPAAPVRAWVDTTDPTRTWVQLGGEGGAGLADGQTYAVTVVDAHSRDGVPLQQPVSLRIAVPPRPGFLELPTLPLTLRYGESFTLMASGDLAAAEVATTSTPPAQLTLGAREIRLDLPDFQQGAAFDLNVLAATSALGAPLGEPVRVHITTPPPFDPPTFTPDDGAVGVLPSIHPALTFPEPVADQTAATRAMQLEPPVAGHWEWTSATRAEFVPDSRLPILTDLTLSVRGGPDGPRTVAGGYLASDLSTTFRTTDFKRMDVSLSHQTMTLYENNVPIRTIFVATGVAAAPTPTGTFSVEYKSAQMRFRGINPDGSHYDIPDVHWVMPFWGDYTIHGAYWRPRFGVPGSDGCVSMSDADARSLFDWADVGTPLVIRL